MEQYSLSFKEADALTQDAPSGDLLDAAVAGGASAKRVTNFLLGRIAASANERSCTLAAAGVTAGQLAELAKMADGGQVFEGEAVVVEESRPGPQPVLPADDGQRKTPTPGPES